MVELLVQIQVPAVCAQNRLRLDLSLWLSMKTHIQVVLSATARPVERRLTQTPPTSAQSVDPDMKKNIKEK